MEGEVVEKHPVCYVLVRRDLPKTRQAIDVGHAAQECVRTAPVDKRTALRVLWVKDEEELLQFANKLDQKNYANDLVYEPDEPYSGQCMSLGVAPLTERLSGLGRLFYHLERMDLDA
jgi:hypothetical protein